MIWLLIAAVVAVLVYIYLIKPLSYWEEKGIPYQRPWPILGNMANQLFRRKHFMDVVKDFYNAFPGKRYNGIFQYVRPVLLIRDLDLIKRITVKDFDHFTDHVMFTINEDVDPLMGKSVFSLKGQRWRDMRATLSPSFTGSKMRAMFVLMSDCAEQFVNHFLKKVQEEGTIEVELKDAFTRFTNDAIATCAFGVECDSLKDRENEFYMMGKEATRFTPLKVLGIILSSTFPKLAKLLGFKFLSNAVCAHFRRIVKENIEQREREGLVRPDMIHLLMEARKGRFRSDDQAGQTDMGFATVQESDSGKSEKPRTAEWTDDDVTAQAMIFFFGGFDSSSSLMCLISQALAENPEVQERLQAEVDETLERHDGKLTYEAVVGMKYLDMVVTETLRKWPLGFMMDRLCVRDYKIEPELPGEETVLIKEGDTVMIPVVGIHRDPQLFPDPDKFDPERFSDENKHSIQPYSYMPFGSGPRNCVASRFALLENKALFAHLMSKFSVIPVKRSVIPLQLDPSSFNPTPKGGYWFGLQQRKEIKV